MYVFNIRNEFLSLVIIPKIKRSGHQHLSVIDFLSSLEGQSYGICYRWCCAGCKFNRPDSTFCQDSCQRFAAWGWIVDEKRCRVCRARRPLKPVERQLTRTLPPSETKSWKPGGRKSFDPPFAKGCDKKNCALAWKKHFCSGTPVILQGYFCVGW